MWSQKGFFVQDLIIIVDQWSVIGVEEHSSRQFVVRVVTPYKSMSKRWLF